MKKTTHRPRPLALIILDGFGYREEKDHNAIAHAHKPTWDQLWAQYPHTTIAGSGRCVGLPDGQMGNSEVGHLNMGAGRIVYQDLTRIDAAIENGDFFHHERLIQLFDQAAKTGHAVHLLGLLSPGGVHSHERHFHAVLELAKLRNVDKLYLHAFLDGRDTPPKSALPSLESIDDHLHTLNPRWQIASIIGRYYAMDRDKRWDRVQKAYDLIANGCGEYTATSATEALLQAYARAETDEFVAPTTIHKPGEEPVQIQDGDSVLFMNFRADRARELTDAFIDPTFSGFNRTRTPHLAAYVCLTEYDSRYQDRVRVAFPPETLSNLLTTVLSQHHLKQLRIAETEKYAHVTFFFNGGIEAPTTLEDRILIPSPSIATYDLQPEMSAPLLTEKLVAAIKSEQYDVIVCNFANPDMVGHSGNFAATVKAIEAVDQALCKIIAALQEVGGEAIITADHGNAERMYDECTKQPHTAHTCDPVPFPYVGRNAQIVKKEGKLSDIAPTMLYLLGLEIPNEMTGHPLLHLR